MRVVFHCGAGAGNWGSADIFEDYLTHFRANVTTEAPKRVEMLFISGDIAQNATFTGPNYAVLTLSAGVLQRIHGSCGTWVRFDNNSIELFRVATFNDVTVCFLDAFLSLVHYV